MTPWRTQQNKPLVVFAAVVAMIGLIFLTARAFNARSSQAPSSSPVPDASPQRAFHIINLSMPKSGTSSIAGLFKKHRSAHEFMHEETVEKILDWREGLIDDAALDRFLLERDRLQNVQVDSASFLILANDRVLSLFPEAKFLFCVRDGEDWIVSFTSAMVKFFAHECKDRHIGNPWAVRYGKIMAPGFTREAFSDSARLEKIKPLLPDLAAFWGRTTLETLQKLKQLPKDRRLVLRTGELDQSLNRLAEFAGVPVDSLDGTNAHRNKGKNVSQVREALGKRAIAEAVKPWQKKIDALLAEYESENYNAAVKK